MGFAFFAKGQCCAQDSIIKSLQEQVHILCDSFDGRGYVNNGSGRAASYLSGLFHTYGLTPFGKQSYLQQYTFPVNTFPDSMTVAIDGEILHAGTDFLIYPASRGRNIPHMDIFRDADSMKMPRAKSRRNAWFVTGLDSLLRQEGITERQWAGRLGDGIYLVPKSNKPLWWVMGDTIAATVIYLYDSTLIAEKPEHISLNIRNSLIPEYPASNIAGYVPGTMYPDSFFVISAHYDHLGKMGNQAVFPGASDNASGTAMLLALARYFKDHPQKYSIAFLLFSGEEAGLLGSSYYVKHPLFPLERIRFLLNIDIMGDATGGITVVNGSIRQYEFDLLNQLNGMQPEPLPDIRIRGAAANSDHYHFSEAGVPAIFIYSNGGMGYYHDTCDRPETLSYKNIPGVYRLLINLIDELNEL